VHPARSVAAYPASCWSQQVRWRAHGSPWTRGRNTTAAAGRPTPRARPDDSTLVLDDDYASTRHARISQQGDEWYVEDLGSTNGTYLDRAKVTGPTRVPLGVPVRIGKTVIELRS
jgi:pSer/pThr/pTyr-binding forkhead associated (FHA) protein